jgi:hypothetical protein
VARFIRCWKRSGQPVSEIAWHQLIGKLTPPSPGRKLQILRVYWDRIKRDNPTCRVDTLTQTIKGPIGKKKAQREARRQKRAVGKRAKENRENRLELKARIAERRGDTPFWKRWGGWTSGKCENCQQTANVKRSWKRNAYFCRPCYQLPRKKKNKKKNKKVSK